MSALDLARSDRQPGDMVAIDWVKFAYGLAVDCLPSSIVQLDCLEAELDAAIIDGDTAAALRATESYRRAAR